MICMIKRNRKYRIANILLASAALWGALSDTFVARANEIPVIPDTLQNSDRNSTPKSDKERRLHYVLLAAGGALVFGFDKNINRLSSKPWLHGSGADKFFDKVEWLGTENTYYYAIPAFVGYGIISRNEKSVLTGAELAAGLVTIGPITEGVKRVFGRKRPFQSDSPYDFFKGGDSFHSGHTATVFTLATVISSNYPRQDLSFLGLGRFPLVPVVMYSMASMVGIQRLYSDVHWGSDVYFGALAGYGTGRLMVYLGNKIDIHLFPLTTNGAPGLALGVRF
jgi:membrane-associated phospholipid phosphatase